MSKAMAVLDENNTITNLIMHKDRQEESRTLKNVGDYMLEIGDVYSSKDGLWYRNGEKVLSNTEFEEMAQKQLNILYSVLLQGD